MVLEFTAEMQSEIQLNHLQLCQFMLQHTPSKWILQPKCQLHQMAQTVQSL
jgi:hypothetical protein